jgi:predicted RNA methylase
MIERSDLDRYYTPLSVARDLVAIVGDGEVGTVVDTACGGGSLLRAAAERWPEAQLRGVDIDGRAVRTLTAEQPTWDVVKGSVYPMVVIPEGWVAGCTHDVVVANPPFTMEQRRYVEVSLAGVRFRCSLAMAHLLSSIDVLKPRHGIAALLPESALYSELDQHARHWVARRYKIKVHAEVGNSTFKGARARCVLVSCRSGGAMTLAKGESNHAVTPRTEHVSLVRGSLPVFRASPVAEGIPFLHSTDLADLPAALTNVIGVAAAASGHVRGAAVLLPRVGSPRRPNVVAMYLRRAVQLSDCVVALSVRDMDTAKALQATIFAEWESFDGLFRGTGARFVTIGRLRSWLGQLGFKVASPSARARARSCSASR